MKTPTPDYLHELVSEAEEKRRQVIDLDQEAAGLRAKLSELQSSAPNLSKISASDEAAMLRLAARTQAISILPQQIEELALKVDNAVSNLLPAVAAVRSAINDLALDEQQRLVKEISDKLRPYCHPVERQTQPGKVERIDEAVAIAWQATVIATINVQSSTQGPPDLTMNGYTVDQRREQMKQLVVTHTTEVLKVAQYFLDNGGSFVSRNLYPKLKS